MIYFKKDCEKIIKYNVEFNKEEIEELKNEIIENCSFIEHHDYESDYGPRLDWQLMRNYREHATNREVDYDCETRVVYHYIFDELKPPRLVKLIEEMLNGSQKAIDKILYYDEKEINIDDRIIEVNNEFNSIAPENIHKKKEILEELETLIKSKKINEEQESVKPYYEKLMDLIKFTLIETIKIDDINRVEDFFEESMLKKEYQSLTKYLKLKKDDK